MSATKPTSAAELATIAQRYHATLDAIHTRLKQRGETIAACRLILVSKTQSAERIAPLVQGLAHGEALDVGENYLSEALLKRQKLRGLPISWHFIGPIQSNKTADIAQHFDWVHTVDREKIARRLNDQRPSELPPLKVLIQVNIDREPTKAGVDPDLLMPLADFIASQPNLRLCGLMSIPRANASDPGDPHRRMALLSQALRQDYPDATELSMGMSGDWPDALDAGASMVRIGTSIFGVRPTTQQENAQ